LRRFPELDSYLWLGWTNATDPEGWVAPRSIVPGEDGAFVADECTVLKIDIPPEFLDLACRYDTDPEKLLRLFIADACGLESSATLPRGDLYSSKGSDEREMAQLYLSRAWGRAGGRSAVIV
jgi:hypothetical protein